MELKGARLASILNSEIDAQVDENISRSDIIAQMARAARIAPDTVNNILSGDINCPPLSRLEGFAEVLGVSMSRLRSAGEADGCEYNSDGKALFCRLICKSSDVMTELKALTDKIRT